MVGLPFGLITVLLCGAELFVGNVAVLMTAVSHPQSAYEGKSLLCCCTGYCNLSCGWMQSSSLGRALFWLGSRSRQSPCILVVVKICITSGKMLQIFYTNSQSIYRSSSAKLKQRASQNLQKFPVWDPSCDVVLGEEGYSHASLAQLDSVIHRELHWGPLHCKAGGTHRPGSGWPICSHNFQHQDWAYFFTGSIKGHPWQLAGESSCFPLATRPERPCYFKIVW